MSAKLFLGSTQLASESSGTITVDNATLGSGVAIPAAGITGVLPTGVTIRLARNEGLVVKYVNATTVDIDADFLTVFDTNNVGTVLSSINLTAAITTSGVNGLDTGSEAAVWYHLYVIYNGTTTASLLSASATSPTMPSGYTYKKYVGAVYNPSSSFRDFYQKGNKVATTESYAGDFDNTSFDALSLVAIVPTTAVQVFGTIYAALVGTHSGYCYIASDSNGLGRLLVRYYNAPSSDKNIRVPFWSPPLSSVQELYKRSDGSAAVIYINGWCYDGIA